MTFAAVPAVATATDVQHPIAYGPFASRGLAQDFIDERAPEDEPLVVVELVDIEFAEAREEFVDGVKKLADDVSTAVTGALGKFGRFLSEQFPENDTTKD